jgi:tripartite ATP-independent transporter DctM subunit
VSEIPQARSAGLAARAEDGLAAVAALGIAIIPLAEIVVQRVFGSYLPGASPIVAHLTLLVGLAGAAIAARDGKLLSLATGTILPAGPIRDAASVLAAGVGAAVATTLGFGGVRLMQFHREAEKPLAFGIPIWVVDIAFPIAFGLIALRLVWKGSKSWTGRALAAVGIAAGIWLYVQFGDRPEVLAGTPIWPGVAVLILGAICGMPIFGLLGGCAVFLFLTQGDSPANAVIGSYDLLTSEGLAALPLFTLAGYLLAEGKASDRLLRLFRACFGWLPGGTAIVTAALCAFFTTFTGGSGVTILALGGLMLPALLADGYRLRFSLGLLTAAGSLGLLFPPALPLILYGWVANVSINNLFLGGLLPGVVMLVFLAVLGVREGLVAQSALRPFDAREAGAAFWAAKWELLMPVVILGSLLLGATSLQSSALAALFALVVQRFVHRDLPAFADVRRVMSDSTALVGGVLVILAVAGGLTNYLIAAEVPGRLIEWAKGNIHSPAMFLLALNGFLIVVGCLMDIFSAIVVVAPLIVPIATEFGIDPVHLGIVFIANLELGYLTPPVGLNLFLSSYRFNKPVLEIARASFPMLVVLALAVLLVTYVPWLTLALVHWLGTP